MSDLVAFLRAQLDEDERVALAANEVDAAPWQIHPSDGRIVGYGTFTVVHIEDGTPEPVTAAHIARHDPVRVLAEIDAKRRIIDLADKVRAWTDGSAGATAGYAAAVVDDTLRLLALPFAGREGWREEWRPE